MTIQGIVYSKFENKIPFRATLPSQKILSENKQDSFESTKAKKKKYNKWAIAAAVIGGFIALVAIVNKFSKRSVWEDIYDLTWIF